jgi:hypothetical protein
VIARCLNGFRTPAPTSKQGAVLAESRCDDLLRIHPRTVPHPNNAMMQLHLHSNSRPRSRGREKNAGLRDVSCILLLQFPGAVPLIRTMTRMFLATHSIPLPLIPQTRRRYQHYPGDEFNDLTTIVPVFCTFAVRLSLLTTFHSPHTNHWTFYLQPRYYYDVCVTH